MQVQTISSGNSFKALYIDKSVDIGNQNKLSKFKKKLSKIASQCDLYIKKVAVPIKTGSDYTIIKNLLRWEIAPLGSNEKKKKSFLDIFKFSKQEKIPKVFIGCSEMYNWQDIKRMLAKVNKNAFNIDFVIKQGKAI